MIMLLRLSKIQSIKYMLASRSLTMFSKIKPTHLNTNRVDSTGLQYNYTSVAFGLQECRAAGCVVFSYHVERTP